MGELSGKAVVVTGAAKRIGRAIALELAREGADVAITFHSSEREARRTVIDLAGEGVRAVALRCDIRNGESVREAMREAKRELGRIDLLVNNAAVFEEEAFESIREAQWDNVFDTNVRGAFLASQAAARELRRTKGRIIHIGSLGGMRAWSKHAHYCASKAALHMLTQAMAKALAPAIAVNAIAPGVIDLGEKERRALHRRFAALTPMRTTGRDTDIAAAVRFFATCPKFITGQILAVDGGLGL
jgi:NAD(P)-dependent dehydrogenase (short-subunit alcohol dehydrogenase family)